MKFLFLAVGIVQGAVNLNSDKDVRFTFSNKLQTVDAHIVL